MLTSVRVWHILTKIHDGVEYLDGTLLTFFGKAHSKWVSRYSDKVRAGWSGDGIPVEARFSAPVQTGAEAHQDSCTVTIQ